MDIFSRFCRLVLVVCLLAIVLPVVYVVGLSFSSDIGSNVAFILPTHPTLSNFAGVVSLFDNAVGVSFLRVVTNNFVYTTVSLVLTMVVASAAAFALATMRFRGKGLIYGLLLVPLMVPVTLLLVPDFVNLKILNLLGGYQAVILPEVAFSISLPLLILVTYFRGLPGEVFESARLDGANNIQVFRHVALPMAWPAVATSVILLFLTVWNEYPLALVGVGNNAQLWNVPLAMASLQAGFTAEIPWTTMAATIVATSVPVTVVFVVFQRRLVSGLEGSVRG